MGMVPLAKLREIRPYVIVGAFVISAVVTPPDVLSQLLLAIPMTLLYELGLFIARFYVPKPADDEINKEDQASSAST
jgi:sec-independent protein translocase protein TatC